MGCQYDDSQFCRPIGTWYGSVNVKAASSVDHYQLALDLEVKKGGGGGGVVNMTTSASTFQNISWYQV